MVARVITLSGVVLQEVREHLGGGEVVDGDDVGALMREHLTERQTTDAAEAVNSNLDCHTISFRETIEGPVP